MLNDQQTNALKAFMETMSSDQALDPKTAYLVRMAAAMALKCYP